MGLSSIWGGTAQLPELPEVLAEVSWLLPAAAWDSEAAQPRRCRGAGPACALRDGLRCGGVSACAEVRVGLS